MLDIYKRTRNKTKRYVDIIKNTSTFNQQRPLM